MTQFRIQIILIFFLWISASSAHALDIEQVRFGVHPDKTRIVIETSELTQFQAFMISDPVRLTIDLPTFVWQAGQMIRPRGSNIENLRYGANRPGISRIVIDLSRPHHIKNAFALPAKDGYPPRIVIDVSPTDPATFTSILSKTYGNLQAQPDTFPTPSATSTTTYPLPPQKPDRRMAPSVPSASLQKPLIVIDAGHGGNDPGAKSANGIYEKNIVLPMAKELRNALEKTGRYRVKLTRDTDTYIKLRERVNLSRSWGADMFISIHADSISKPNVRGASIYTLSNKASDAQTAELAASENRSDLIAGVDLSHEDQDIADILIDLATRDTMNQSRYFANVLVDNFKARNVKVLPNPHRYAGFAVLKSPDVPSVLIEAGFVSNNKEAELLTQPVYRAQIIEGIIAGFNTYFQRITEN